MIKYCFSILFLLLLVISFNYCNNNTEPTNPDKFEISSEPIAVDINVKPDSLQIEHFPTYSIDYSILKLNGTDLTGVKNYYPCPSWDIRVDREFILAINDSFVVEIKNCNAKYEWLIDLGNIEFGEDNNWLNSEVTLIRKEDFVNTDSSINHKFIFNAPKEGKGYVCFIERNSLGEISSNESHGLLIGYTTNALNKILLNIDEIKWKYNIEKGTFSTVSVKLKGTTNIYRLRGMTFGDGVLMAKEITILNDDSFEIEIPVAFSHMEGVTLKTNSELLLYGTVGLPKIIPLINPKSDK